MFPIAPNPTRVRLFIAEKAVLGTLIPVEDIRVDLPGGEQNSAEFARRNPMKRLPVLELEDGHCITESATIIEYLEECFPENPLIGTDPLSRARIREIERITDLGVLGQIGLWVHASNSPLGLEPRPALAERAQEVLLPAFDLLENLLSDGRPFLVGDSLSIADCTLAAALQFARFGKLDLPERPHIQAWDERYRERPAAKVVMLL